MSIASQVPRSEVIVCTDGLSNTGLGALDVTSKEEKEIAMNVYRKLGTIAKQNSVTINVIGIEGEDCGVPLIFKIALNFLIWLIH